MFGGVAASAAQRGVSAMRRAAGSFIGGGEEAELGAAVGPGATLDVQWAAVPAGRKATCYRDDSSAAMSCAMRPIAI